MFYYFLISATAIAAVALLARANKSNKLFWTFLVSLLLGFAGGSASRMIKHAAKKKVGTTQVSLMQAPMSANAAMYSGYASYVGIPSVDQGTHVFYTKPAGRRFVHNNVVVPTRTLQAFNPDYDIGKIGYVNTS